MAEARGEIGVGALRDALELRAHGVALVDDGLFRETPLRELLRPADFHFHVRTRESVRSSASSPS